MFVSSIGVWDWQDTETHRIFHYFFILDLSLLILLINSSRTKMIKVILLLRCSTIWFQFVVAELSCVLLFATPWTAAPRLPWPLPSPKVCSNSRPLSRWCHPTISSSVVRFSSHLQSFPASGSFQMSQLFTSGGQNIGASVSASFLEGAFLCMWSGRSPDFEDEKYVVWQVCPSCSFFWPALVLVVENLPANA